MPSWDEILQEVGSARSIFDATRDKYVRLLSDYTKRNTIVYYSAFLQKGNLARKGVDFGLNDQDKNGFMTVVKGLDKSKGLDLILHTPGGEISATESIVVYLKSIFGNNIRAIIPQMAMSAGTMIACSCQSIIMGKQSCLGPIDPQFRGIPAHGIIEEFDRIKREVSADPSSIYVWREILNKYSPTFIGECEKAIKWSEEMVKEWLRTNMLATNHDKDRIADRIINQLGNHAMTLSHSRHVHMPDLMRLGLVIEPMESDQELQDRVLSVHHAMTIGLSQTDATKIIQNQDGKAFIQCMS